MTIDHSTEVKISKFWKRQILLQLVRFCFRVQRENKYSINQFFFSSVFISMSRGCWSDMREAG